MATRDNLWDIEFFSKCFCAKLAFAHREDWSWLGSENGFCKSGKIKKKRKYILGVIVFRINCKLLCSIHMYKSRDSRRIYENFLFKVRGR